MNIHTDLNLSDIVYLSIILYSITQLLDMNGYSFYFWWRNTANQLIFQFLSHRFEAVPLKFTSRTKNHNQTDVHYKDFFSQA